jgi:hypothetical protein
MAIPVEAAPTLESDPGTVADFEGPDLCRSAFFGDLLPLEATVLELLSVSVDLALSEDSLASKCDDVPCFSVFNRLFLALGSTVGEGGVTVVAGEC